MIPRMLDCVAKMGFISYTECGVEHIISYTVQCVANKQR